MTENYDVAVIGLGAVGSAALYSLSKHGIRAIGIDQYTPPHSMGSSHGETRITRQALGEGAHFVRSVKRSDEIWKELEASSGSTLFTKCGCILFGNANAAAHHSELNFIKVARKISESFGIESLVLSASEVQKRYPHFSVPASNEAFLEPNAGYLRPESCIKVLLEAARKSGAKTITNCSVHEWDEDSATVTMKTCKGNISARRVIIAVGPWTNSFLGEKRPGDYPVCRQALFWYDISHSSLDWSSTSLPTYVFLEEHDEDVVYGFPSLAPHLNEIKLATENFSVFTTPENVSREVTADEVQCFEQKVRKFLPDLGQCTRATVCMYTLTEHRNFVVDYVPGSKRSVFASACGGHGFKHSAAIGELCAELALGLETTIDGSCYSLSAKK